MTYTPEQIADVLDYAVLKPTATSEDVKDACALANKHGIKSVCVAPCNVPLAASLHSNVSCVIGFPHGNTLPDIKYREAMLTIEAGAKELDVVVNYGRFLDGDVEIVNRDLLMLTNSAHERDVTVKAILESCHFTPAVLRRICGLCVTCGVDFVKTSTGFAPEGATPEAVQIMLDAVGDKAQVKASGGIKTYADAARYLDLGCTRLGSSRYLELLP